MEYKIMCAECGESDFEVEEIEPEFPHQEHKMYITCKNCGTDYILESIGLREIS